MEVIIDDKFAGTAMKQFGNGAAIVDSNPDKYTEFVTVNKLINDSKTAKDENVETLKNFIFELDNESIELQTKRAGQLFNENIVNRAVFSGSKSIHCRITIADEPDNKEQYKFVWKALNDKYFNGEADKSCSNPARLTRRPGAIRSNGVLQKRLFLSDVTLNFEWRGEYLLDKQIYEYLKKPEYLNSDKTPIETLLKRNIPIGARKLLENSFSDGEKHLLIPGGVLFLKKAGYSLEEVQILVKNTNIKNKNYDKFISNIYIEGV